MTGRIKYFLSLSIDNRFNPSSANPLSVFDHFVILALKGLKSEKSHKTLSLDLDCQEAAVRRCSYKKMFWAYTANLQEYTNAEMWFQ